MNFYQGPIFEVPKNCNLDDSTIISHYNSSNKITFVKVL